MQASARALTAGAAAGVAVAAALLFAESGAEAAVQRPEDARRSPSHRRRQDSPPVSVDTSVAIWDGNAGENG